MSSIHTYDSKQHLRSVGKIGEQCAQEYLIKNGYEVLDMNVYSRWGELDIIARKKNKIHFIEVKTRTSLKHGNPYEAVRIPKIASLLRAIQYYILEHRLKMYKYQLDVISIILDHNKQQKELKCYENVAVDRIF